MSYGVYVYCIHNSHISIVAVRYLCVNINCIRIQLQALTQDGENIDDYVFECGNSSPKKRASISLQGNGTADDADVDDESAANDIADAPKNPNSTEEAKENVNENQASEPSDQDQDQIQLTMADSDKLDNNTLDNEDSLNLTIGEDEAKIFQDEVNIKPYDIFSMC